MKARPSARLCFALWPDAAARASLAAWQPPLQEFCGGKAMRVDTLHLTLLRHAKWDDTPKVGNPLPTEGWTELTPPLPQPSGVTWQAREFALVQSERTEEGAHYRVLATFPLC